MPWPTNALKDRKQKARCLEQITEETRNPLQTLEMLYAERDEAVALLEAARASRDGDGKEIPALRSLIERANEMVKQIERDVKPRC